MNETRRYEDKTRGHIWVRDEFGVDVFAYNPVDPHNGPRCSLCGYGFCHHCLDVAEIECTGDSDAGEGVASSKR